MRGRISVPPGGNGNISSTQPSVNMYPTVSQPYVPPNPSVMNPYVPVVSSSSSSPHAPNTYPLQPSVPAPYTHPSSGLTSMDTPLGPPPVGSAVAWNDPPMLKKPKQVLL